MHNLLSVFHRLVRKYQNKLYRPIYTYIRIIDLMQPNNGYISTAHLIIVSRMLDIQLIREGKDTYWDWTISQYTDNLNPNQIDEFANKCNIQTKRIIDSMDEFGWDYKVSQINVNKNPISIYNGTHRSGYCMNSNPLQMVPICIDNKGWFWAGENGEDFLARRGMPRDKISILIDKYNSIIRDNKFDYLAVFRERDNVNFDFINNIGRISSINLYRNNDNTIYHWFNGKERLFMKKVENGERIVVVKFWSTKKSLYYKNKEFHCHIFDRTFKDYVCMYSPTITKAIEYELWIRNNCSLIKDNEQ